jgi:assimilatory nitrate reductase catalytic subunit
MTEMTRTTCPYCGVGCGVLVTRAADGAVAVKGDPEHPANFGRLCSKGTALAATLGNHQRLLQPQVDGVQTTLDTALDAVASRLQACVAEHGPDSVALYVSGQLLTEDYYVANKLMKGYVGSANIDTNSRLCMSSAVAGHVRAFGEDVVPVEYSDLECADLIVLVGSNLAWCHPVLMQRIQAVRETRPGLRLVVIDPRRTSTSELADLHLPLRSGADVMLFNGLLAWLADGQRTNQRFVAAHTAGLDAALATARASSADVLATAQACGLDPQQVEQFFAMFAATERVVTLFSQGVNQSSAGVDKVNSIINCHLLTGRIGRAGMGPFSITGQPNAMGGREVGGLANMLAVHLSLDNAAHRDAVQTFWSSPRMASKPGLKAVDLFAAIDTGQVKAVWVMATNPVVSLPDADLARRALAKCPLVIVSDCVTNTDTLPYAHIRLPAAGWSEKDGTVTNSDRYISRQRAFVPLPEAVRPDWWLVCEVAQRMGFDKGFDFANAGAVFSEYAAMTKLAVQQGMSLDLQGLAKMTTAEYDAMTPQQWPVPVGAAAPGRVYADGKFSTSDGRARFVATPPRGPRHAPNNEFPLILNTGRVRDQWHTMTRTGRASALNAHEPEPFVDMHPADMQTNGIAVGSIVRLVTRWGAAMGRARSSGDMTAGMIFMPIHWSEQFAWQSRVGAAVNPVVDPISGEPEFKHTPVRVEAWPSDWRGFVLSRVPVTPPADAWWCASQGERAQRLEFSGRGDAAPDAQWLKAQLGQAADAAEWIEYKDVTTGNYRAALVLSGELLAAMMVTRSNDLPSRNWLMSLFAAPSLTADDRRSLLLGRLQNGFDPGSTVCACFSVGVNSITQAIDSGCATVDAIGQKLRAGTNCGSCRPELAKLLATHVRAQAAVAIAASRS